MSRFDLTPEKRALLEKLLLEEGIETPAPERITRRPREGPIPLSFAQERLWFLDQLAPGNPFYSESVALRLRMPLNIAALERSLNEIIRRHEVLRTTFQVTGSRPVQIISPSLTLRLPVVDLRALPAAEREAASLRYATEDARRTFDLVKGPPLHVSLLRLGDDEFVFLLAMHHIVCDGWSLGVFWRELGALYTAFCAFRASALPELPIQYADFAIWQREWLQGEVLSRQLNYWKSQLQDLPVLQLPVDFPRPPVFTFRGNSISRVFPPQLLAKLKAAGVSEDATLFMTLLAAFSVLLHRYSGQNDIVIGTPIANRNQAEIENLIGFFVNTLVMRTQVFGHLSFRELLCRVRSCALDAYAHQDLPFETLVGELHPERDLSRNPLFQVILQVGHAPNTAARQTGDPGLPVLEVNRGTAKFDLRLDIWEVPHGLQVMAEYSTDLFEAATIEQLIRTFETLLEEIADHPDRRVDDFQLLTAAERQQILVHWNDTQFDYPREACVHELFERVAERLPNAVAVRYGDRSLSYGELNRLANRIAHRLIDLGVDAGTLAGLGTDRCPEMIACMLAVLKAGGAYVPLDPDYPEERLSEMIRDAGLTVVLAKRGFSANAITDGLTCLDPASDYGGWPDGNPPKRTCARGAAYVMYTSGSTGIPKGAVIPHRAIVRLVRNTDYVQLTAGDVVCQASNSSFDAATFEIWGALLTGAVVVGVPRDVSLSPSHFASFLREQGITTMFLTVALFNQVVRECPSAFSGMRHMLFGGEAADVASVRRVLEHGPPERLLNAYGPTESTTFACCHLVESVRGGARTIPIGKPIANTTAFILDAQLRPVPPRVPGELFLGGDGLAIGYLHRPALTAERFIPHPFATTPGARLYRTGDLARSIEDGSIEFLGRFDGQVKLRGFRIETGEVEAALVQHAGVQQAAVIVREEAPGDKRLIAYVGSTSAGITDRDLRCALQRKLPEYMIPSRFVILQQLPLTQNGKIDRQSLAALEVAEGIEAGQDYTAPRNELEETLAGIWTDVLKPGAPVSVHSNLFSDLGAHSLLATQVVSRIRSTFAIDLPLQTIFEAPTIAELAEVVEELLIADIESTETSEAEQAPEKAATARRTG